MVARMDRDAIARGQRRRQAQEALEVERDRAAMLEREIEDLVTELHGARIDEEAFAAMQPEDVDTVRAIFDPQSELGLDADAEHESGDEWAVDEDEPAEAGPSTDEEDPAAEVEAEIARLESELATSRQHQQALERYLDALGA